MAALATITIDVLSRESGIDTETIRAYERLGLVGKPRRVAGNLLLYRTDDINGAIFAQRALGLGFSPQAVRELLRLADRASSSCAEVHRLAHRHLTDIKRRITELKTMEKALAPLLAGCTAEQALAECPIIQALVPSPRRE
jgi:MerR family mercuric resistance operon transcriptional regulator